MIIINYYLFIYLYIYLFFLGQKLKDLSIESGVESGGLKRWVDTRWHTMYDCIESIICYRVPLEIVNIKLIIMYMYYFFY